MTIESAEEIEETKNHDTERCWLSFCANDSDDQLFECKENNWAWYYRPQYLLKRVR